MASTLDSKFQGDGGALQSKVQHIGFVVLVDGLTAVFRAVVTPNRTLPSLRDDGTKLSYNACIREYSMVLPSLEIISILHNLSILPTALDLKDGFKSLQNSIPTALSCLSHYYRNDQGTPCVSSLDSDGSGLQVLVPLFSFYGFSDTYCPKPGV